MRRCKSTSIHSNLKKNTENGERTHVWELEWRRTSNVTHYCERETMNVFHVHNNLNNYFENVTRMQLSPQEHLPGFLGHKHLMLVVLPPEDPGGVWLWVKTWCTSVLASCGHSNKPLLTRCLSTAEVSASHFWRPEGRIQFTGRTSRCQQVALPLGLWGRVSSFPVAPGSGQPVAALFQPLPPFSHHFVLFCL